MTPCMAFCTDGRLSQEKILFSKIPITVLRVSRVNQTLSFIIIHRFSSQSASLAHFAYLPIIASMLSLLLS
ncbi:hypothetical protein SAEN111111_12885 [Saccharibacillus endophyticus]